MNGLIWEIDWILKNIHRYDSASHAMNVIINITERYCRNKLISRIKKLRTKNVKRICSYSRVKKHT